MRCPFFLVDAFAAGPFSGNPAGVCVLEDEPDAAWMQSVAAEVNQAETAFCWPVDEGFGLRWFTPFVEVDLCGHATLATAHALQRSGRTSDGTAVTFFTKSGPLVCAVREGAVEMDFPSEPPSAADPPPALQRAVPEGWRWIGRNRMDWFVELDSIAALKAHRPDFEAVKAAGMRGLILTARGDGPCDFASRFFAPQCGVPEDHATGSAHCALGPYWSEKLGMTRLTGFQLSPRGAVVGVEFQGARTVLRGAAVTVCQGEWQA